MSRIARFTVANQSLKVGSASRLIERGYAASRPAVTDTDSA